MLPESIDQAKQLLYGHGLESFIAERDALVKQIRTGGDRDLANAVKALRKPSAVAADVNQIVRADPAGIELILQAAALLRSAQTGALEGSTVDASQLQKQYRAAIQALSQSATSRRAEVRAALEAATIDESSNDDLRSGCLVVVPTPPSLFGTAPVQPSPAPEPEPDAEPGTNAVELAPVDELEERRARRRSSKAQGHAATPPDSGATAAAAAATAEAQKAEAAAEKKRAAEAEAQRKRDEKERLRKLKALKKTHREAVRSHLAALDAEGAAGADVEEAEQMLVDIDEEQQLLEQAIIDLQARRDEATASRVHAADAKTQANERAEHAEAEVDALADAISALEDA